MLRLACRRGSNIIGYPIGTFTHNKQFILYDFIYNIDF